MKLIYLIPFLFAPLCFAQSPLWSNQLDPSRAENWQANAGFKIPAYTVPCSTQPSLLTGSGNAGANATAIQNALASCDATHNVVNLPAGTYYVEGIQFGSQGKEVLRGAGANLTDIILTADIDCGGGAFTGVCRVASNWTYSGDSSVQPPSGSNQCAWTGGYSQGTTSVTISTCGSAPTVGQLMILDQANDTSDTNGVYMCDGATSNCTYEGARNANGRVIGGNLYSETQTVMITSVSGSGTYTVGISPSIHSTNIRSGQSPGAWFPGTIQLEGLENMTLDGSAIANFTTDEIFSCYECWDYGVTLLNGARSSTWIYQSQKTVLRSNYYYGAQSHAATSYNIETDLSSEGLVENNIMQQTTTPINMNGSTNGFVVGYNFAIDQIFSDGTWNWPIYASHATANNFNLYEGNIANGVAMDNASGPADQNTIFRNLLTGKQPGTTNSTTPILFRALNRNNTIMGNALGTLGYHTGYQAFPTSTTVFSGNGNVSIFDEGSGGTGDACALTVGQSTLCDPLTFTSSVIWGNYDTVNAATQWSNTQASPAANTYANANFSSSYFAALPHTLPNSFYSASAPSWWPSGKTFPVIGPDISSGNIGTCSGGTYAGWLATKSGQCTGGTFAVAWASHAISNPAMDCYLNVMGGPLDGSGSALTFNAETCYPTSSSSTPTAPTILLAKAVLVAMNAYRSLAGDHYEQKSK
jgi:hypothetical protein